VAELTPNRSFTWETNSGGVKGVATHVIEPDGDGSKVTLSVTQSGIGALLLSPFLAYAPKRALGGRRPQAAL